MTDGGHSRLNDPRWRIVIVAASIVLLAALHWTVPLSNVHLHSLLQHLSFLPIVLCGLLFGWRYALVTTIAAGVFQLPHLWSSWSSDPAYVGDVVLELPVFGLGGVVTGWLSERERRQRTSLEKTKRELEEVYQELQQNFERLKKAERLYAAGQLSAGLAHEIRTPLTSISGAAGILKRGHASSEYRRECLEIIEKETQRLNHLLSCFLDFARPRAPRFQMVDLLTVFDSVIHLAQHAGGAASIEFLQEVREPLPEVRCDPEQLKQVLLNLIMNAIQATEGAGVIRLEAAAKDSLVSIRVSDEGGGVPSADLDHIFDPFFTTKENGTGLGLAVAAKIVEQHGGWLSAERNPDRGMTFRLELPLGAAQKL